MNYLRLLRVKIVERIEQLIRPRQNLIRRKRTSFTSHHLREIIAWDKLHYEELAIAFRKMVAHARQRGMVQTCKKSRLTLELFAQAFVGKQCFLQRNGGIETLIDRLVDSTHTALSELSHDAITAL